ncbi:lipid II flippase MurJ [Nonomuraea sediminis]|uniref:lipid II flippase MurJ n=1 Tax=Nonomuraea sediminis TaxID=2835864 RepID=UPI001BDC4F48|nr:lipid II flippase MurJ [Nonomuraea sediminis]
MSAAPVAAGTRRLMWAASLTMILTALGSMFGFGRDLLVAGMFGASASTDAFMVAWTVPETAAPLLIEGALSYLLIPAFSRRLEEGRPIREVVWGALPRSLTAFLLLTVVTALGAPLIVELMAPGMADHALATRCTQITSITVAAFGLAGYLGAALRTRQVFGPPAAIYLAYNATIITFIALGRDSLGITAVAWGVAAGGILMVLVQAPAVLRYIGAPMRPATTTAISLGAFVPIASFTLLRQAQIFIERFVGSSLPAGAISYLNYAQKIAQVPMVVSLIIATVSFPALARSIAARDHQAAQRHVVADIVVAGSLVLVSTVFLVVFAPEVVRLLLEHGAFTATDTEATAWTMRLYAPGLLGQVVVGALCRVYFCGDRPSWYPALAMGACLVVTGALAPVLAEPLGTGGIALANAAGISLGAVLLLVRLGPPLLVLPRWPVTLTLGRLTLAAGAAAVIAALAQPWLARLPLVLTVSCGGLTVIAAFAVAIVITGGRRDLSVALRKKGGIR